MITLNLSGQIKSGKNNMLMTRSGHHYPNKKWAEWRDRTLLQIRLQYNGPTIDKECKISVNYFAGDKRRRDVPGMVDALWHCFEKAGIVTDDKLFTEVHWISAYDKNNPRVDVQILA